MNCCSMITVLMIFICRNSEGLLNLPIRVRGQVSSVLLVVVPPSIARAQRGNNFTA